MSGIQQSLNSGQTQGKAQGKAEEWMDSAKNTAHSAKETANSACDGGQQQQKKEEAAGFLSQTGEQMANMAQGAIDGVKNTLGVGGGQQK